MAHNVIYFNSDANGTLADIVNLPYTDVIVCFLRPGSILSQEGDLDVYGDGAAFVDGNLQGNIQALQNAGKNVLVSFGGDPSTISSSAWKLCAQNVRTLVHSIEMFVLINGFNGVDIDYEDNSGFDGTGGYDGVQFLVQLTSGLAQALPSGHNIITHAPQTPYWDSNYLNAPYSQIWQRVGGRIAWINNQFYNNSGYDQDAPTKVQWYKNIAGITGPQKLLMGVLLSGGEGVESLGDMVQNVIPPLQSQFGAQFGGVMGW
jgi:chitinase